MKCRIRRYFWTTSLTLLLTACNLGASPTPDAAATLNPLYTAQAQTLEALALQGETNLGGETASPTTTLTIATSTASFAPAPIPLCNAVAFIKDVTIPDGSFLNPGEIFTKIWRLKNIGTCVWTKSYALVFVSGDGMSAPSSTNLPANVNPGETVDLAVNLMAATQSGHYHGKWKIRTANGVLFGIGPLADIAFWVDINVNPVEYVVYDFVTNACIADWINNNGTIPCPGTDGDENGYVLESSNPHMENGTIESKPGLLTVPKHSNNGYIRGKYPAVNIQSGDHFKTIINCQYKAITCDVLLRFEYKINNGLIITLAEWHEVYEGSFFVVDLDLSFLANKNVNFYLTVTANDNQGDDLALWLAPRIVRQGNPPPTATATSTFTPTSTMTTTLTSTATTTSTNTPTETLTPTSIP
ncbi:MAG: NBR1-Ig-like domain-containing protein [Anaerolineae bacterium]|nr:NBR1-Ig-like domain-containing protein [Anaerolineae bacterium]MDK1119222.1 NBR1-Ig-like domain-containing protein [Anaerolineae bacterium]